MIPAIVLLAAAASGDLETTTANRQCGLYCYYVATKVFDPTITLSDATKDLGPPPPENAGYALRHLADAFERRGLNHLCVQTSLANLKRRGTPIGCVAHVDQGTHFVLILDADDRTVTIFDPARMSGGGKARIDQAAFAARWHGVALLVSPQPLVPEEELNSWWTFAVRWAWIPVLLLGFVAGGLVIKRLASRFSPGSGWATARFVIGWSWPMVVLASLAGCDRRSASPAEARESSPQTPPAAPQLVIDPEESELTPDEVRAGRAERTFSLTNRGNAPLRISDVVVSCVCTTPTLSRPVIDPMEQAELSVLITPDRYRAGAASLGVVSNDPRQEQSIVLTWRSAPPSLTLVPPARDLGLLQPGVKTTREFHVENAASRQALEAVNLDPRYRLVSSHSGATDVVIDQFEPGRFRVDLTPSSSSGAGGVALVLLDAENKTSAMSQITYRMGVDWEIRPLSVMLALQSGQSKSVRLIAKSDTPVDLTRLHVTSEPKSWLTEYEPFVIGQDVDGVHRLAIDLTLAPDEAVDGATGELRVTADDDPNTKSTIIPIRVMRY